ncbi:MAG: hypothetical protein JWN86_3996 [Planctomycetota bacterium]|nr:hypothetical protein [Planctomycetota bacterium]
MRLSRVRLRVSWLMIVIAIVAIVLGGLCRGLRLRDRRSYYSREVARHRNAADWYQRAIHAHPAFLIELEKGGYAGDPLRDFPTPDDHRPRRDQHLALERKYRRAAATPWVPIEPDPPLLESSAFFALPPSP